MSAGDLDSAYRLCDLGLERLDTGVYDLARPHDTRGPDDPFWLAFAADPWYARLVERLGVDEKSLEGVDWEATRDEPRV